MTSSIAATGKASSARRGLAGQSRLGRLLYQHGASSALGLALGLLALGPGLARGFLLSYDMVFVPDPPVSGALVGLSGGPPRAVPSDAAITVAARVLPSDIVQKIVLLLCFSMACAGASALLSAGWRASRGRPAPLAACLVSGVFYTWNPFVAERLLIGQWALLLGYAGLPWVLRELCTGSILIKPKRLVLFMLPAAIGGFAAMVVTGLAAVAAAGARGHRSERGRRLAVVIGALLLLSLPWLVPSLISAVHTDPRGADVFAARADTPLGRLGSLVMLSGIWNAQTVPRGYGGTGAYAWLLVVAAAIGGYLLVARRERAWAGLGSGGLLGLAVAAVGISVPTRAVLHGLVAAWPGFAVLRDGQQFVATLALVESVGIGSVIAWLLSYRAALRATQAAGTRVIGTTPAPPRTEAAALALAVLAMLAPVVLLPGLAWGAAGRLRSVEYPPDWLAARQFIDGSAQRGSVLLLPWAAYRRYAWNHGEAVYDPWSKLLSRELISNDGLRVGSQTLTQESPASIRLNSIVGSKGPLTVRLRAAGVRFVVVDAGPLLTAPRSRLAGRANLPGARVLLASRDLVLFLLPGPG